MFSGQEYIFDGSVKDLNPGMYFCTDSVTDLPNPYFYFVNITSLTPGNEDRIIKAYDPYIGRQYALCRINGVWAASWSTEVLTSDLPQWRNFSEVFGTIWLTGLLDGLKQSNNYEKFEYSSGADHEGLAIVFKRSNTNKCVGIFIPGAGPANDGRIFIINGIPNDSSSWICKDII